MARLEWKVVSDCEYDTLEVCEVVFGEGTEQERRLKDMDDVAEYLNEVTRRNDTLWMRLETALRTAEYWRLKCGKRERRDEGVSASNSIHAREPEKPDATDRLKTSENE